MLESDLDLRDFFDRPWLSATGKRTVAMEVAQCFEVRDWTSD